MAEQTRSKRANGRRRRASGGQRPAVARTGDGETATVEAALSASEPAAAPPEAADAARPEDNPQDNPIDRFFASLRFYHGFNAAILLLVAPLALTVPQLTLLPLYLAAVARIPCNHLHREHGLSYFWSVFTVVALAFLVLLATVLAIVLPLALQALQVDGDSLAQAQPMLQQLGEWARGVLISFGVDPVKLDQQVDLSPQGLFDLIAKEIGDPGRFVVQAAGVAAHPFLLMALAFLVLFLASYALGYSTALREEVRRFLGVCWPPRTVDLAERVVIHAQRFGAEVFRGYSWMVLVLGIFYLGVYLGAISFFQEAQDLPPLIVVALVVISGVIGAIPGLGAKVLLLVGAASGLLIGVVAVSLTGSYGLGLYIFIAVVVVTGFESKFGTPTTLGRALGVNSALMLYLAIATVAAYGFNATLWAVFVILPALVGAMRVMVEEYGEPEERG